MFRVINFAVLIRCVAIATTFLTLFLFGVVQRFFPEVISTFHPFMLGSTIAVVLTFLLTSKWSYRMIWTIPRLFNGSLFPDLNGVWEGEIVFDNGKKKLHARAVIRQFLLKTEIDMHTETAKSSTLEATPVISSGQFKLYYTFSAKPKEVGHGTYTGSTIFDIRLIKNDEKENLELSGFYYTDRMTRGRTRLTQTGRVPNVDVSYY